jgi:serine/threonine-protein phosphatase 6 regulatory ankyrin repeat subunit B
LIRGGSKAVKKNLRESVTESFAGGILLILISHLLLFGFLYLREPSVHAEGQEARNDALLEAIANEDLNAVTARLDEGSEADARTMDGSTPLMLTQDPRITRRLLAAGADVNARNREGSTALIQASMVGALETTRLLLQAGADLELRDTAQNKTALEWALWYEHEDVVKALRAAGAKEPVGEPVAPR